MTAPLTVRAVGTSPAVNAQSVIIASIPARFRLVAGSAEVLLASCADLDSITDLDSVKGVFLTDIGYATSRQLNAFGGRMDGRSVVVASIAEHALTPDQVAFLVGDNAEPPAIIDCRMTTPGDLLKESALEQIAFLEAVAGPVSNLSLLGQTPDHLMIAADFGDWSGARLFCGKGKASFQLDTISRGLRRRVNLDGGPHASPAHVHRFDSAGSSTLAGIFEGGIRRDWLELHNAVAEHKTVSLGKWVARLAVLEEALLGDGEH